MKPNKDLWPVRVAGFAILSTILFCGIASRYRTLILPDIGVVFVAFSVILGTFRWALMNPDEQVSEENELKQTISHNANLQLSSESDQFSLKLERSQLEDRPRSEVTFTKNLTASSEPFFEVSASESDSALGEVIPRRVPTRTSVRLHISSKTPELSLPRESSNHLDAHPSDFNTQFSIKRHRSSDCISTRPTTESLNWCGKGQAVDIGPYKLIDALVYTCNGTSDPGEASCINLRKRVGRPVIEPSGSLGYYPTYDRLTADQRANYLQWLASGRSGPLDDIGYAFLYFYGLERRFLVEGQDLSPIVKETVRLLETYDFSGSFDAYLSTTPTNWELELRKFRLPV